MKKYYYTYKVEHIDTKEYYYGSRSSDILPEEDKNYLGSPTVWHPDKSKLEKKILGRWEDHTEALLEEAKLIRKHIKNDLNRNYHIPNIKFNLYKRTSKKWLTETYGEEKGLERYNMICRKRVNTRMKNDSYKVDDKTREKISNTLKGNIPWNEGRKLSEEHVDNIKKTWHSDKRMKLMQSEPYKNKMSKALSGDKNPMYGKNTRAWVNNKIHNKLVKKEELPIYLKKGWSRGMIKIKNNE